ncbi:MAG: hypothetical protein LBU68_02285, partial [Rickettsiales bacterium]|nr:hypothetical protein [Rickettsiales bacterium]
MKFEKIYTGFSKQFVCLAFVIGCIGLLSACSTDWEDYPQESETDANSSISLADDTRPEIVAELGAPDAKQYESNYSQFKTYSIDRSYKNSVDYPMDVEAYYASRFSNNKKKEVKKQPFLATPVGFRITDEDIKDFITRVNDNIDDLGAIEEELSVIRAQYAEILSLSKYCC